MLTIGVTGGIGAGKSTLVEAFERLGGAVFSADAAVHALYRSAQVRDAVVGRWGTRVLAADGNVDRAAVAEVVFADDTERAWLEQLLHPLVGAAWDDFVAHHRGDGDAVLVAEVPLLFEAGLEGRYDAVVTVTAPLDVRLARVAARGAGDALSSERAATQLDDAAKAARSDYVIANAGTPAELDAFARAVLDDLARRAPGGSEG